MDVAKYLIGLILIGLVGYHSVYFQKLDEVKAVRTSGEFNSAQYAHTFWNDKLIPNLNQAVELQQLLQMLQSDPEKAFDAHSHALGIGNLRYFLVKGTAKITSVNEDELISSLEPDGDQQFLRIATEFIFGNAVRDATGLISINEFSNTMDFNNVSAEINKIIREEVLPGIKAQVKNGDQVAFIGAIELNKEHLDLTEIEVIPIEFSIQNPRK